MGPPSFAATADTTTLARVGEKLLVDPLTTFLRTPGLPSADALAGAVKPAKAESQLAGPTCLSVKESLLLHVTLRRQLK